MCSNVLRPLSFSSGTQGIKPSTAGHCAVVDIPCVPPRPSVLSWLNIVFDLNGIVYACEEFHFKDSRLPFTNDKAPHSATMLAHISPKFVWMRPGCNSILKAQSEFGTVSIWSSMKVATTRTIAHYLFKTVTSSKVVHGQEHYKRIITSLVNRVPKFLKVEGTNNDVFLKTLSIGLFPKYRWITQS